jgi:hypothetical protein
MDRLGLTLNPPSPNAGGAAPSESRIDWTIRTSAHKKHGLLVEVAEMGYGLAEFRAWLSSNSDVFDKFVNAERLPYRFLTEALNASGEGFQGYKEFVVRMQDDAVKHAKCMQTAPLTKSHIPQIMHRIWLTDPAAPSQPSDELLSRLGEMNGVLDGSWQIFFWINDVSLIECLRQSGPISAQISFILISELKDDNLYSKIHTLVEARRFVLAADLVKVAVLKRFGGVYCDLGVRFSEKFLPAFDMYDLVILLGQDWFFQTSFIACAAQNDLLTLFHAISAQTEVMPKEIVSAPSELRPLDEVHLYSGPFFSFLLYLFRSNDWNILPVKVDGLDFRWYASQSWATGNRKFGNALLNDVSVSTLSEARFDENKSNRTKHLTHIGRVTPFTLKLDILVSLTSYFDNVPSPFCRVLKFFGSDKASGWHNYGFIYNYIIRPRRDAVTLLEVGIGTPNVSLPSNMGASGVAGASLRAWRSWLPDSTIYGADVDRQILFRERRIETFFVDQLSPPSIDELAGKMPIQKLDIVIDDGLHTFQANSNLLQGLFPLLRKGALYIVEDIQSSVLPKWAPFLEAQNLSGTLLHIPSVKNSVDNNLLILFKE